MECLLLRCIGVIKITTNQFFFCHIHSLFTHELSLIQSFPSLTNLVDVDVAEIDAHQPYQYSYTSAPMHQFIAIQDKVYHLANMLCIIC